MIYLEELNEQQLKAVKSTEGYLRVIAGAGSGKTKLLVSRYVYLVSAYGINPANILCVTFTNKAAKEMKNRITRLLGNNFDSSLICTYHGFCARILREDADKIFYPKNFQILDNAAQKGLLEDIYQQFELKLDHGSFEKIISKITAFKSTYPYVSKMCGPQPCQILSKIDSLDDQIFEEYFQRQIKNYALDFQDLINFALHLLHKNHEVRQKWQEKLNYIQVDEFQDSTAKELELIDILSNKYKNLMIVGDPDQNIYEWRGSDVNLLVDFDKNHIPCQTAFLTRNYRSTSKILCCANTLIKKNKSRLDKDLYTENNNGADVLYYHETNEVKEATRIVDLIKSLKNMGYDYSDFAILYRSSFLSWQIEKKLNESQIPYEIYSGVKFYQRMEIQDIIAYLRLICFDDDVAFKRIVNKPRRRFGKIKMQKLLALKQDDESLFDTLRKNLDDETIQQSDSADFVRLICDMRQRILIDSVSDFIANLCIESGYEKYIRELGDQERLDNLSEFKRIVVEQESGEGEELSFEEFLGRIALQTDEDFSKEQSSVKLMTIHSSKGLEFPVVFLMGVSENVFPNSKSIEEGNDKGMEAERRLCYVALTRAKERLIISESEGLSPSGKSKIPSRFLMEIGVENFKSFGIDINELQTASQYNNRPTTNDSPSFNVGQIIEHPIWGKGEIQSVNKINTNYRIKFLEDGKERDILSRFFSKTPLEPIKETTKPSDASNNSKTVNISSLPIPDKPQSSKKNFLSVTPAKNESMPSAPTSSNALAPRTMRVNEKFADTGWRCIGVTDLGAPGAICQLCKKQTIRYVHHMENINGDNLDVGCVCAGKLTGDVEKAKEREKQIKEKAHTPMQGNLSKSKNGNYYTKINNHLIVVFSDKYKPNQWRYSIDGNFSTYSYCSKDDAYTAAIKKLYQ